ncbi:FAD-dependent oxidoreductase [Kamptonema formosum]|uniref:FAD-dependent oxidoreductase n=1 Tax=Kamptonema formosum TaxID=331992 RepID=UPI00034A0202|nr:FAD-dependent oxidoreductase [Oscillatoria sp. PCC 10802]
MLTKTAKKAEGKVLVIGAGVTGLTTSLCLQRQGFEVTVVAEKFAPHITSVVAGALWEWPPAVCGHHQDPISLTRSKDWCVTSYNIFSTLADHPETGVFMRPSVFYFKHPVKESTKDFEKMLELQEKVLDFSHDAGLIEENGVSPNLGLKDAYSHLSPMVDTDVYMDWLLKEVERAGCYIKPGKISGYLTDEEQTMKTYFGVDAIINCTGLGATELTNDTVSPLRGALIRIRNDGKTMPRITKAHCVSHDGSEKDTGFIFIVPRGHKMLLLGGFAEANEWDLNIGLENYRPIQDILDRCLEFLPVLKNAQIDPKEPVRVGLRPLRQQNVRLEQEQGTCIIHNYGHGGSGVSFSWGCALEVVEIAKKMLSAGKITERSSALLS